MAEQAEYRAEVIADGLRQLGVQKGDVVLFHSDLRSLGRPRDLVKYPNCGADLVIDGWLQAVGPDGLAIVPTLSATFAPGEPGPAKHVFDPDETPSRVGSITEVFRKRPEARRSKHPTHSLAAIGARADEFVKDHENLSTFGRQGPYGRYYDWDGWICFFGTDMRTCTTLHAVEDWMDLPYMEECFALVKGPDGKPQRTKVYKSPCGPRDFYRKDSKVERYLESKGFIKKGTIYNATVHLMSARKLVDYTWSGIVENPTLLLVDPNSDPWSKWACAATIAHVQARFKRDQAPA